ncbi:hypothetical protein CCMSSC00406_0006043 [Pleurotus cornucopiae]|uniref:Uncharacterized protein n=1 Tax=Pleurotus cornucopiae TaxID=5321 RepID=A0ACB7ING7_PLECO|nr:hypothetical protein CCMSSC00406_0006043 [Pleurotus cornucopiae]
MRLLAFSSVLSLLSAVHAAEPSGGDLYPPGLLPLINRANVLLSTGQFNEAAKVYTEAIEQSPTDYLLFYKRATAYFSLNRHSSALDDFEKVLSLTSNTFDNAHLMKARIHTKDGHFADARTALKYYAKAKADSTADELLNDINFGEQAAKKTAQAKKAQLWTACTESATEALRIASHSIEIRQQRVECAMAVGDLEGAVGDMTRLSHLAPPTTASLIRIFRLSYFFLPPSPSSMSTLKQCLHLDPDSKPCLTAHRLVKAFDKAFAKLEQLLASEDWKGVVTLLTSSGKANDLAKRFDDAMQSNTAREQLLEHPSSAVPLPDPTKSSPRRKEIVSALCKSYVKLGNVRSGETWCEELLKMDGAGDDPDGLVGRGEALLKKEEYEDAVRAFEKAFESSGRSNRDIHARLQRAQKLLKQSKQKDYYKVLGVSRDADQKTIKKAFRKAAMTAHPDKGGSEAKMATVNEAYEVLSNPELRERFDNGDDPNDPMGGQGGFGGHPFHAGGSGHPFSQFFQQQHGGFQGGSYQFHFGH